MRGPAKSVTNKCAVKVMCG